MTTRVQPLTIADWEAMPHDDGNRYEIIEGELFVSCSPGLTHQIVLTNLIVRIGSFLETNPLGTVVTGPGLILSNYSGVIPDLVFFLNEQRDMIVTNDKLTGPPNLVVEIVSPGLANIRRDCDFKLKLYSKHGVPEYWLVHPKNFIIEQWVNRGGSLIRLETLRHTDTLKSDAIPGFSCQVSEIFKQL